MSSSLRRALVVSLCRFSGRQLLRMTIDDVRHNFPEFQDTLYSAIKETFSAYTDTQGKRFAINTRSIWKIRNKAIKVTPESMDKIYLSTSKSHLLYT